MAYDNAQMAAALGALLNLDPAEIATLADDLDQWALGGARLATWSRLATDVTLFNNAAVAMVHDWYGGTANGGPNGDGTYPLMNSEGDIFMMPSPARLQSDMTSFDPRGSVATVGQLPATGEAGDLWVVTATGDAWGWSSRQQGWRNLGRFQGPTGSSAKQIVIAAGQLPAGATDAQFATWLANSQKAAVQPLLDDAKTARDQAVAAKADAETDAQTAAANAQATSEDRAATAADAQATGADRLAIGAAAQAATEAAQAAAADRQATGADAEATDADRQAAQSAAASADADAQSTAADRAATAADAQATAEDRQAATAAAQSAEADAQATAADRQATGEDHTAVQALRAEALGFRNEAEQFRNEAGEIAGGDFLTEATADGRYRKLADLLAIADVNGLGAALAGKVTTQQLSDAIQAIVGMAPADLDTLKEIADRLVDAEGDYAALVSVIAQKADAQAVADALGLKADKSTTYTKTATDALLADKASLVGGKVPASQLPAPPTVPVKTTGAALRAATNDTDFVTPKSVADAAALVALTDAATIAVDLAAGTNFTVTLAGNRTLGAPTNAKPGMSGTILIKQDATGSRTLAYNTAWKPFGSTPALSTAASTVDLLTWIVEDTGKVRFTLAKGGAA